MHYRFRLLVEVSGPRPPAGAVIDHIWGRGVDVDSDGDSRSPEDREWTDLWVAKRPECTEIVSVLPDSESPLVLAVESDSIELAQRVAVFIAQEANGRIVS